MKYLKAIDFKVLVLLAIVCSLSIMTIKILQNEIKQDEPVTVITPTIQGYSGQSYIDQKGKLITSTIGNILYTRVDPVTLAADPGTSVGYNYININLPAGTLGTSNMLRARIFVDSIKASTGQLIGFVSTQSPPIGGGGPGSAVVILQIQVTGPNGGGYVDVIIIGNGTVKSQTVLIDAHISDRGTNSSTLKQSYQYDSSTTGGADASKMINLVIQLAWPPAPAADNSVTMRAAYVEVYKKQ